MGDEISRRYYDAEHFSAFRRHLDAETALLRQHFAGDDLSRRGEQAGFELEAWLIDEHGDPLPKNEEYLEQLNHPLVVPELASFNIELNGSPTNLSGRAFSRLLDELGATWRACIEGAERMGCRLITIGILPTVKPELLNWQMMSKLVRYRTLNDRVMALRDGKPLDINIEGKSALVSTQPDVMLEAAATSFQIHLQCRLESAVRDFNATLVASAPIVAAGANSPFLFGHDLWDETRIPLFEQAVNLGEKYPARVGFGSDYVRESLFEIFEENQREHPILIPAELPTDEPNHFNHVRFHNGTVWRWNRPLLGFDFDGQLHLRIEHRVVAAGPTLKDSIANGAFYYGLVRGLGTFKEPVERRLPFEQARENFYKAARYGLNARVLWVGESGERELSMRTLIMEELLPLARRGLQTLDIPNSEIDEYLDIIGARVDSSQNGAAWQRRWVNRYGPDLHAMVRAYRELQDRGQPVHTWSL
jgi:gamma-glutamyl:cysteine ligase YbdK (ATP-grasp superfamily)